MNTRCKGQSPDASRTSRLYLSGWFRHRILSRYIRSNQNHGLLLDIGGGTGNISARFCSQFRMIVVLDNDMQALHQINDPNIVPVLGDARQLPFKNRVFHRALSVDFQEHLDEGDIPSHLREAIRVLEDSGVMATFTSCRGFTIRRYLYQAAGKPPRGQLDWSDWARDGHQNRLRAHRHKQLVEQSGFRLANWQFAAHLFDPLVRRFHIIAKTVVSQFLPHSNSSLSLEDRYRSGNPSLLVETYFWALKWIAYLDCILFGKIPGGAVFMKLEKNEPQG